MRIGILFIVLAASACGSSSAPATKPPLLASVKVLSGASQTGTVQAALGSAIVIEAVDSSGLPIAGLGVAYGPSDGSVNPASATTDSTGRASTIWTLGLKTGPDTLLIAVTQSGTGVSSAPIATVIDTTYATANP